jgi:hypothetical protein
VYERKPRWLVGLIQNFRDEIAAVLHHAAMSDAEFPEPLEGMC